MSGKTIAIILGVAVIGGGIWWATSESDQAITNQSDSSAQEQAESDNDTVSDTQAVEGTASMRELIARGEALECSFAFAHEDGTTGEGTGYFAGDERMRMDTDINQNGEAYNASYIVRDDTMYMWGEMQQGDFGMQLSFEHMEEGESTPNEEQMPVEMDEEVSFECGSWSVDESVFSLPAGVEFMDMDAMMQGMQGMTPEQMQMMEEQYSN